MSYPLFMMSSSLKAKEKPLVTFGVLTDVQYADCDNFPALYDSSKLRFYRKSLEQIDVAFSHWKSSSKIQFVLQLGDIIDGRCQYHGGSYVSLRKTLEHFEQHNDIPTFHTVGNHELYNFNRKELAQLFYESVRKIDIPPEIFTPTEPVLNKSPLSSPVLYYQFSPSPHIKCISLDCFDISVLGYDQQHPNYKEAARILQSKHGHDVFADWDSDGPLDGLDIRYQQMNGAVGGEQLSWLDEELSKSEQLGQKVIVFGHVGISPESTDASCILWNYDEVTNVFHKYNCVVAYFAGHSHNSGYAVDSHGISYVVFNGIIETPPTESAFATVLVFKDHLKIEGHGMEVSHTVPFEAKKGFGSEVIVDEDLSASPATVKVQV